MADFINIPERVNVEGVNFSKEWYKTLVEKGTRVFDDVRLNAQTDIIIATYPRTGTTWLSQIVSLLYAGEPGYEEVSRTKINDRAVYMELEVPGMKPEREKLEKMKPPRLIKTHLPYKFLTGWVEKDKVKTIVTFRNPKDTLVSMYHFYKISNDYEGTWNDFFAHVQAGKQLGGDQVEWMEGWLREGELNKGILILKYEDMLENLPKEMKTIIDFLGIEVTEKTFDRVIQDASFNSMKSNPMTLHEDVFKDQSKTKFIRSGKLGQWKEYFTVAQNEWFDEKYGSRLENHGLNLKFD